MDSYINHFKTFANTRKWVVTKEDKLLIREIFALHTHFTEHDLISYEKLKTFSLKKMHDGLMRLVEAGMIRKIFFSQNRICYEHVYGHAHHDHLACMECGKIQEFRDEKIERQQVAISEEYGYKLIKHSLHLLGLCSECQEKLNDKQKLYGEEVAAPDTEAGVPLSVIPGGESAKVINIEGGRQLEKRLSEMGVTRGGTIQVITNRFSGPMIVKIKGSRVAMGHHLTHKIIVEQSRKRL